jgi:photosystem II stability/assembly factor-like uncharacterized protein
MKTFLPKCLPAAFALFVLFSACKKSDQPLSNEIMTWKAISMPSDAMMDTDMTYNLSLPPSGTMYLTGCNRIYASDDGGTTWKESYYPVNAFPNDTISGVLGVSPNGVLYSSASMAWSGGVQSALHRSRDGGTSWDILQIPGGNNTAISTPAFNNKGDVYLGIGNSVCVSGNNASSWSAILTTDPNNGVPSVVVAPEGTLYVGIANLGILRSSNNGATWDTVNAGLPSFAANVSPNILGISPAGVVYLAMPSTNTDSAAAGILYYLNDGGARWQQGGNGLPNVASMQSMFFLKNGNAFAVTPSGCFTSTDGVNWSTFDLAMPTNEYRVMGVDARQNMYIGDNDGLYKTVQPVD